MLQFDAIGVVTVCVALSVEGCSLRVIETPRHERDQE